MEHRLHSPYEKSLMERANQYLKDRIEEFDDYYPCPRKKERSGVDPSTVETPQGITNGEVGA